MQVLYSNGCHMSSLAHHGQYLNTKYSTRRYTLGNNPALEENELDDLTDFCHL